MNLGRRTAEGGCPHMVCGAALGLSMMLQPLSSLRAKALALHALTARLKPCPDTNRIFRHKFLARHWLLCR
jgi:hypothetical protein